MIKNITIRTSKNGSQWWRYLEICDKCGQVVQDENWEHSCPPDESQADFCLECMRFFLDNNIDYDEARDLYKK
jgi:hypothetical protein